MFDNKRKEARRPIRYTAWIAQKDKPLYGCVLSDVSDNGARLDVETTDDLPDEFMLFLSRHGSPRRRCHVAWRTANQLGVRYESPLPRAQTNQAFKAMIAAKKKQRSAQSAAEPAKTDDESKTPEPA